MWQELHLRGSQDLSPRKAITITVSKWLEYRIVGRDIVCMFYLFWVEKKIRLLVYYYLLFFSYKKLSYIHDVSGVFEIWIPWCEYVVQFFWSVGKKNWNHKKSEFFFSSQILGVNHEWENKKDLIIYFQCHHKIKNCYTLDDILDVA